MTFMTKSGVTLLAICRMGFNHRLYNVRVDGLMELSHTHTGKAIIVRYRDTGLIDIKLTGTSYKIIRVSLTVIKETQLCL